MVGLTDCDGSGPSLRELRPKIERLKKRQDFLRAARCVRSVAAGVTLELCPSPAAEERRIRVGFTASKKTGNAVARNRAKRRLRAAAQQLLPLYGLAGNDYVLVARRETLTRPFGALLGDLESALVAAHERLGRLRTESIRI
ncbi:MAG TPA: ribonuclease P protein component [Rhizomicrobium sp.]|nr:ribonuclease P protein component [Rhizomicrobium sp.]